MILQPGTYAILNDAGNAVLEIRVITVAVSAKDGRTKPVTMTAQPAYNAATQKVVQNGWTINANDVTPVWQIVALTTSEIGDINWRAVDQSERALALVTMDEVNNIRQWLHSEFKAAVAAASNFADLKARIANLSPLPNRTTTQLRNAVAAKLDGGPID